MSFGINDNQEIVDIEDIQKDSEKISNLIKSKMADEKGYITYAGQLLSDDCSLLQSRIFCTRWAGKQRGSLSLDALDDKEYAGIIEKAEGKGKYIFSKYWSK